MSMQSLSERLLLAQSLRVRSIRDRPCLSHRLRRLALTTALVGTATVSAVRPAAAWHDIGHRIVAAIAWSKLTPAARSKIVYLLKRAPADTGLADFRPASGTDEERDRELFIAAATWPDFVRPKGRNATPEQNERTRKYHKAAWHYINFFWDNNGPGGAPRDHPTLRPPAINAVERLRRLTSSTTSSPLGLDPALRIAWILHLAGDLHQPLHTSARVTDEPGEEAGDRGGNTFVLTGDTLHGYWDASPDRSITRNAGESTSAYVRRCADQLMADVPETDVELKSGNYKAWALEGLSSSKFKVYVNVERHTHPSSAYSDDTWTVCKPAIAAAGYRLADTLNRAFAH